MEFAGQPGRPFQPEAVPHHAERIDIQDHKASSCQLNAIGIASFPIVLVPVDVDDSREPLCVRIVLWLNQFCPDR